MTPTGGHADGQRLDHLVLLCCRYRSTGGSWGVGDVDHAGEIRSRWCNQHHVELRYRFATTCCENLRVDELLRSEDHRHRSIGIGATGERHENNGLLSAAPGLCYHCLDVAHLLGIERHGVFLTLERLMLQAEVSLCFGNPAARLVLLVSGMCGMMPHRR